jgi:ribose 5-phosphate isomerase A
MSSGDAPERAAKRAVDEYVESGMVVGLGTGFAASHAVRRLGELLAAGELRGVRGIPTSARTADLAEEVGIPLVTLAEARPVLTIDGADEIEPGLALIKGRGGALLREKIVAHAGQNGLIVVAGESKLVDSLGEGTLPVEVEPFGWEATLDALTSLGRNARLRTEAPNQPFVTDGGHYTVDCLFDEIPDPEALEARMKRIPGVIETGLFIGLVRAAVVGRADGVETFTVKEQS